MSETQSRSGASAVKLRSTWSGALPVTIPDRGGDEPASAHTGEIRLRHQSRHSFASNIRTLGIVTLTFVRQPEVDDDFAAYITLRFGRTCPAARH